MHLIGVKIGPFTISDIDSLIPLCYSQPFLFLITVYHTKWFLYTETRPEGHSPLLKKTRGSRMSKNTTELLFITIYKPRRDN